MPSFFAAFNRRCKSTTSPLLRASTGILKPNSRMLARHRQFFQAMDSRFQRLTGDDAPWQIYDLGGTPGPMQFPADATPSSQIVTLREQIQFRGASLRPLIGWPRCFEVINYWRCLKPLATDLQVSVQVTDP